MRFRFIYRRPFRSHIRHVQHCWTTIPAIVVDTGRWTRFHLFATPQKREHLLEIPF